MIPLRLLLIEDLEYEALLIIRELRRGGYEPEWERVDTAAALSAALSRHEWDLITCDWVMPGFGASAALALLTEHGVEAPIIIISGEVGEEVAVTAMKAGAHDFVSKQRLTRLVPAVERELRETEVRRSRRRAEEALRSSERRYRRLFETAKDGILILDALTGRIMDVNPFLSRLLGYSREQMLGKWLWEISPFKDVAENKEAFEELQARAYVRYEHLPLETKDGERVAVEFVSNAYQENGDRIIQCNVRDITERKRAEEQFVLQSAALASAANGIVITDRDGQIIWVNPAFTQLTGYASEEAIGRTPRLLKSGMHDRAFYEHLWGAIRSGQVWSGELINRRKDGTLYTEELRIAPVRQSSAITHFIGIQQDITERKKSEQARQRGEQRFRTLIEKSLDLVAIVDRDGTYRYANPAHEAVCGVGPDELVGTKAFDLLHPEDAQKIFPTLAEAIWTHMRSSTVEYRLRHQDGSWHTFEGVGLNLLDDPEVAGILITGRDITARKQAEDTIRQLNQALEQRVAERTAQLALVNAELEAFSSAASHDLRAPLRHIEGFIRILLEDYGPTLDVEAKRCLDRIQASTQHMGQLIHDLLSLSHVARKEMALDVVDLSGIAQTIAADLHRSEPNRKVEFTITPGLVAKGDARLLRVVLENLLGNAWKYTSKHPTARIAFGTTANEGSAVYFVRDDGAGFNMAHVAKVFAPFGRLHGASEFEGTGIGLATVQRIIHRHGGRIWTEAAPEQGATFYFTLGPQSGADTGH